MEGTNKNHLPTFLLREKTEEQESFKGMYTHIFITIHRTCKQNMFPSYIKN